MSCPRDEHGGFKIVTRVRDRYRYPRYQIPILNGKNDFIEKVKYRIISAQRQFDMYQQHFLS